MDVNDLLNAMESVQSIPRIVESPWVPEGTIYLMNDRSLDTTQPENWKQMTTEERITWAAEHGWVVLIRTKTP